MDDVVFARRRSVDVGGLALALAEEGSGHGWGGWEETENGETKYAEVLIDVRAHTETIVNLESIQVPPFIVLEEATRHRLVNSLCTWNFEPHKLPEEEVVACSYILFEALYRIEGMQEAIGLPLSRLASFLQHLRQVYRQGNSYHNFQHALDVFQATYHFLYRAGMVPPVSILLHADARTWQRDKDSPSNSCISCLTAEDIFALSVAAVGHDVGHPGLTNAFMKNARTPLAVVYDDKSVLEQMHYSLILQIMRHNGLGSLLDRPSSGLSFRKLLLGTVLATDLSLHQEFMANFRDLVAGQDVAEHKCKILICQSLIKCADISNPSRPYSVSKHWAAALESEWTCQLQLEQHLHLPATVKPSDDSLGEAKGQVWFISTFAKPLFELVAQGIPELDQFAQQCRENLSKWEARSAELSLNTDLTPPTPNPPVSLRYQPVENFLSAFPPTLPDSFRTSEEPLSLRSLSPAPSHHSSSGSSGTSHYQSCESGSSSPFETTFSFTAISELPSPIGIATAPPTSPNRPLSVTSVSSYSTNASDARSSIRAAYKASVRKKKSWHRSSWNPSPGSSSTSFPQSSHGFIPSPTNDSPLTTHSSSPLTPLTTHSSSPLTPLDSTISHERVTPLKESCDPPPSSIT